MASKHRNCSSEFKNGFVNYCKGINIPPFGPVQPAVLLALEEVMNRLPYPSDLSDDEWALTKPLIPVHQGVGHPQTEA